MLETYESTLWLIHEFGYENTAVLNLAIEIMNGNAEAMKDLAVLYEHGDSEHGIIQNMDKASYWYGEAAKRGNVQASYHYGNRLAVASEVGKHKDILAKGEEYIKYAADQNHAGAQLMMGIAYNNGFGVEASREMALYYLKKALENGEMYAQEVLREII